jgi:hypothetical protein
MSGTAIVVIFVVILTLLALYVFGTYNELVTLQNRCKKAVAQLEAGLQRRDAPSASQNVEEIASLEKHIAFSRQLHNDAVTNYNTYKHKRPTVWVASLFGHGTDASPRI